MNNLRELKERVTVQIMAQLQVMTEEETRAFVGKLLDIMSPENVLALNFAYEMTPNQKRGSRSAGAPVFGRVLYESIREQGNYRELLLADEEQARLILCVEGSSIRLFRTEWMDKDGYTLNSAQYTLLDAIKAFREAVELQKEEQKQERPFDTFKQIEALEGEAYQAMKREQERNEQATDS